MGSGKEADAPVRVRRHVMAVSSHRCSESDL